MPSSFHSHKALLLAALFVPGAASTSLAKSAELRCAVFEVSSPQSGTASERARRARRYSATEILDLEFHVFLPGTLAGEHRLDVRVETPDQKLYQVLTVPFEIVEEGAETGASGARRVRKKLADLPRPIAELRAASIQRGRTRFTKVSATLPVAGTSIVSSSLYGTWTATAFLDGSMASCGPKARFLITE
jgi:hypothetical protein